MSGSLWESDLLKGTAIPTELLERLPKVDVHIHLDGSLRFETFAELSQAQGVALPGGSVDAARALFAGNGGAGDLASYLELFDPLLAVLQDANSLRRVARELIEDCAAENVRHAEIRFSPSQHTTQDLDVAAAVQAVLDGIREGRELTGISAGLIITGVRQRGGAKTHELAKLTVRFKREGVIGFDLAGVEPDNPAKDHLEAFYEIRDHNINCTVHAGEAFGPESIHQAVHYLGAHRIGHGTRLLEDSSLARYVADHRIPIEVGLSSAARTGSVSTVGEHPLRRFLALGIRVTLTTNNRLLLANSLTHELRLAADTFDLTLLEIENLVLAGFKSAFLPQKERTALLRQTVGEFNALRKQFGLVMGDE